MNTSKDDPWTVAMEKAAAKIRQEQIARTVTLIKQHMSPPFTPEAEEIIQKDAVRLVDILQDAYEEYIYKRVMSGE